MENRVIIFDTTLRDGEQAPGASMTIPEKTHIARQLAKLGVDVIEAGFPISSPIQADGIKRIVNEVEGPTICALARAKENDIQAAADSLKGGNNTRIHTFIGTSDIHIEGKFSDDRYGKTLAEKRATVIKMATEAVLFAKTFTDDVEFSAEDAGRTDIEFLKDVLVACIEAGATTLNIPDTTGYCLPNEYSDLIKTSIACANRDDIVFSTHCHNDLGLAVANSLAGVAAGARQVECTINGIGERAGNAALEELVMALRVRRGAMGVEFDTRINTPLLMSTSKLVSTYSGFTVQPNKAIVGRNAFSHEAGIHQDGVLKRRDTYEIMSAEDVGQDAQQIFLGRHSGRHGFFSRLQTLGFSVESDVKEDLYKRFLKLADQKKEIFDEDIAILVKTFETAGAPLSYSIDRMSVVVTTEDEPTAEVSIRFDTTGDVLTESATGDGPVDAIYRAIDHVLQHAYSLSSYTIESLTEGQDAVGEVTVKVDFRDREFIGRARNTDILKASADAYIDALNHVEAFRFSHEFASDAIMNSFNPQETE